ncbi:peptidoglycan DD-metalloendopeptidase family protein [Parendozoicomonas haliclonae]|uniref:Murein hydrolase activator EnvC n=2 Tax=Parendozoicomonas haliclonae TaxID=1960125 RepID=A0A1X7AGQ1_9GAMM|nr:Murein hydrolase activator EnvC precursor [Parendozoicomonas haliclonae]
MNAMQQTFLSHKLRRTVLSVSTVFVLALSAGLPNAAWSQDDSERLQKVTKDIEQLQSLLNKIRKERSAIETRLEQTEKEISQVQSNLRKTESDLKEAKAEEKKQQARRREIAQELANRQQEVARVLKAAYLVGQSPRLKLALNQQDPAKASRMMAYYDHFSDAQAESLRELNEADRKMAHVEQQLAIISERIRDKHERLSSQAKKLKTTQTTRTQTLAQLNNKASSGSTRLNRLQKEQKELEQLLSSIIAIADVTEIDKPFSKSRGQLRWPLKGKVLHKYGDTRDSTHLTWNGIFIKANSGSAVTAPHHGRVVFSNWMKSFGQLLIIDHGSGYMTLYAHNQELLKAEGDWVLPGERIALAGNSGGQPQTGLYFEVRHKGRPANPMAWLGRG